jgi:hypothetical protein
VPVSEHRGTTGSVASGSRAVDFSGAFERSQLVVGDHNTVHLHEGTVVQVAPPGAAPTARAQPRPQSRLPRAGRPPLGRDAELRTARAALADSSPVELHGPAGIGKTALIRHLSHDPGASWPDGIVHARVAGQPLEDVLQWLFDVFWATTPPWAPGPLRVREYLRDLRALVVLDDVGFSPDETAELLDAAVGSAFLLAATEPHLDPTGPAVALGGLPEAAALGAFERCLGRALDDHEREPAAELINRLDGVPALVLEAARMIRDGVCALPELAERPAEELARLRVVGLTDAQRRLLALLAALAPAAVPTELLAAAGSAGEGDLAALERAELAESSSPRYALARPLDRVALAGLPAVDPASLLGRLAGGGKAAPVEDVGPAAVAALRWGRRVGALDEVVTAARAVDPILLQARRTGVWGEVTAHGAAAARDLGRAADEAYFLHQQGTRWLCLGETALATKLLGQALDLRERLGDELGAAASRHNLDVLHGGGGGAPGGGNGGGGRPPSLLHRLRPWGLGALGAAAGLAAGVAAAGGGDDQTRTLTEARATVTAPGQTVTAAGRTVTDATTVTAPGNTVTAAGRTVTAPGTTVTAPATTVTVTETVTITVNRPRSSQSPSP